MAGFKHVRARNEVGNALPNYYNAKQVVARHSDGTWSQAPSSDMTPGSDVIHTKVVTSKNYNPWGVWKAKEPSKPGDFYKTEERTRSASTTIKTTKDIYGRDNTDFHHKDQTTSTKTTNDPDEVQSQDTDQLGTDYAYTSGYTDYVKQQEKSKSVSAKQLKTPSYRTAYEKAKKGNIAIEKKKK